MRFARAVHRPRFTVGAVLATVGTLRTGGVPPRRVPPRGAPPAPPAHACAAATCALGRPTTAELDALVAEANRILARYANDSTPLGRQCYALGVAMRAGTADVRMLPYMWRAAEPDGTLAPVTGDVHPADVAAPTGAVHIARGFDPLNPDRGLSAILQTARHEFAHLTGARQTTAWGLDAAARLATACGPP